MSLEEIMQMANKITFFFADYGKKQTTNPKLRSLRLGTTMINFSGKSRLKRSITV
jgi:hypothetical protein